VLLCLTLAFFGFGIISYSYLSTFFRRYNSVIYSKKIKNNKGIACGIAYAVGGDVLILQAVYGGLG
jgi:hypothetical protein